jgi:hypothetical protein
MPTTTVYSPPTYFKEPKCCLEGEGAGAGVAEEAMNGAGAEDVGIPLRPTSVLVT